MGVKRHGTRALSPTYWGVVATLWPTLTALTKRDWRGVENLQRDYPPNDGIVVAANHISWFDPLAICHVLWENGRSPRILIKDTLFTVPGLKHVLRGSGQIPVARATGDASASVAAAVDAVRDGEAVVLYPEGTITRDPGLWPMTGKTGAARIALTAGAPVIPVAQWGAQDIMRPYTKEFRILPRKTMHMLVGPPVDLDDLRGQPLTAEVLDEATARIIAAITGLLEELRAEHAPADRLDFKRWQEGRGDGRGNEQPQEGSQ